MSKIYEKHLAEDIKSCYADYGSFVKDNNVVIPKLDITVQPLIYELKENMANFGYYITSPKWRNPIFECSAAFGENAVGMAQGSFLLGIMDTVETMINDKHGIKVESEFAGHHHKWTAYLGNIVSVGDKSTVDGTEMYWKVLKDEILKRIGNQDICCIKVYAANFGNGEVTGECRINDISVESLGKVVKEMAKKWDCQEFISHKQFFLFRQDTETLIDYLYTNEEIADKTETAMMLFESCMADDKYDSYFDILADSLKDISLANDLHDFIPEICAENAFDEVRYAETLTINLNGELQRYYKTQLADYYPIMNGVFRTFEKGVLKDNNKVYRSYIEISAVSHTLSILLERGSELKDIAMSDLVFTPSEGYIVR